MKIKITVDIWQNRLRCHKSIEEDDAEMALLRFLSMMWEHVGLDGFARAANYIVERNGFRSWIKKQAEA